MAASARLLRVALIVCSIILAGTAHGQSAGDLLDARRWYQEGVALQRTDDWVGALAKYEKALGVKRTPQLLLRVGICHENLGRLATAEASYRQALESASSSALAPVAKLATRRLKKVSERVPHLRFVEKRDYPGVLVSLDGNTLSSAKRKGAIAIDPGSHAVRVTAPHYLDMRRSLNAREGQTISLDIELEADPKAVAVEVPNSSSAAAGDDESGGQGSSGATIGGVVAVVGGGLLLGAGTALFVVALGQDGDIDDQCGGPARDQCPLSERDEIEKSISEAETLRGISFGFGGLGIASIIVGTVLLALPNDAKPGAAGLTLLPVLGPRRQGLRLRYSF